MIRTKTPERSWFRPFNMKSLLFRDRKKEDIYDSKVFTLQIYNFESTTNQQHF